MVALIEEIRNAGEKLSRPQRRVRVLTADLDSTLQDSELRAIANFTFNPKQADNVMKMLNQRLHETGKNSGHIVKALTLLSYLIRYGSMYVLGWCALNKTLLTSLIEFHERDVPYEIGYRIQTAAKEVNSLLADKHRLAELRNEAAEDLKKKNHEDELKEMRIQDICFAPPEYAL